MALIRKIISALVFVVGVAALVSACMSNTASAVYQQFADVFAHFDFKDLLNAIYEFLVLVLGTPLIITMLGLIGMTIPGKRK